jgi:hypothetical protein
MATNGLEEDPSSGLPAIGHATGSRLVVMASRGMHRAVNERRFKLRRITQRIAGAVMAEVPHNCQAFSSSSSSATDAAPPMPS